MATHDYIVDNQNGANFRSDLNNALAAIVSNNSSATAPTTTYAFMMWADTANDLLKQRNAADSAWVDILTLSTGAVSNAEVADNAITLAKMAHGTDGEIITYDASGAPATVGVGTSGQVLTSNGAGSAPTMQDAAAGGKVLQVVSTTKTDTTSIASSTFTDIPSFSVSITPSSTTSKILVTLSLNWDGANDTHFRFERGGSAIAVGDVSGNRDRCSFVGNHRGQDETNLGSMTILDSPNSTSVQTYTIGVRSHNAGTCYINRAVSEPNSADYEERTVSTITVMEIGA